MDQALLLTLTDRLARQHHVPGAQVVICDSAGTTAAEVGEADHATAAPMTRSAKVPLGSIGKAFTAAVTMVLVADGDVELDEPIGEHLPELGTGPDTIGGRVTLRQLLSHTSGLPSTPARADAGATSLRRYLRDSAAGLELVCPPGAGFSYSNLGYVVIGRLIEVITGMSWYESVSSVLLRPLGIVPAFTGSPDGRPTTSPIVTGHTVHPRTGRVQPVEQTVSPALAPAGALALSALDLAVFGQMHLRLGPETADLLGASEIAEMHRLVPAAEPFGLADGWGLGLAVFRDGPTHWVGHDGTADGTSCHLRMDPTEGRVVALTTNASTGAEMWHDLVRELRGLGFPVADYTLPVVPDRHQPLPADCLGHYVNGDIEFSVAVREDGPYMLVAGEAWPGLTVHDGLAFSVCDPASGKTIPAGRFLTNSHTGRISAIQTGGRIARRLEPAV